MADAAEGRGSQSDAHRTFVSRKRTQTSPKHRQAPLVKSPPRWAHGVAQPRDGPAAQRGWGTGRGQRAGAGDGRPPPPDSHVPLSRGVLESQGGLGTQWDPVEERGASGALDTPTGPLSHRGSPSPSHMCRGPSSPPGCLSLEHRRSHGHQLRDTGRKGGPDAASPRHMAHPRPL